ncbi:hypothetical protein SpCBS45565_g00202 [Spizellomyces sp. 'palustris']|nr:hypothetical protein SpCBS45565_g00202 [Spizellomyces sp. 'palustris']
MSRSGSISSVSSLRTLPDEALKGSWRRRWGHRRNVSMVKSTSSLFFPEKHTSSGEALDIIDTASSVYDYPDARSALLMLQERMYQLNASGLADRTMDAETVGEIFELALDAEHSDLGDNQREAMRRLSKEKKLQLIRQLLAKQESKTATDGDKGPSYYIEFIQNAAVTTLHHKNRTSQLVGLVTRSMTGSGGKQAHLRDVLAELKVQCSCQTVSWLLDFMEQGGFRVLFTLLEAMHRKPDRKVKHYETESEVLKILKILVNHNRGVTELLSNPSYLNILILSLDSPLLPARTSAADFLLALVTLEYPRGHRLVMRAFDYFRSSRDDLHTFERLVLALESLINTRGVFGTTVGAKADVKDTIVHFGDKSREQMQKDIKDFLISAVTLLRLVVDIPQELEYRIHLRNELLASGFSRVLKRLRTWAPAEFAEILTHVDAFEYRAAADHQEFADDIGDIMGIDMENPQQLLDTLLGSFRETEGGRGYITSILQHLLIPTRLIDGVSRTKVLRLLDLMIAQVVLDRNGIDPSFTDMYRISVEDAMEGISEQLAEENEVLRTRLDQMGCFRDSGHDEKGDRQGDARKPADDAILTLQHQLDEVYEKHNQALAMHQKELDDILQAIASYGQDLQRTDSAYGSRTDLTGGKCHTSSEEGRNAAGTAVISATTSEASLIQAPLSSTPSDASLAPTLTIPAASLHPPLSDTAASTASPALPPTGVPPPPAFGGPPPPPPGAGGPPPPPGSGGFMIGGIPKRPQKYRPSVQVRRFQWDKVPESEVSQTIWAKKLALKTKLDDNEEPTSSDLEKIAEKLGVFREAETLFALKSAKMRNTAGGDVDGSVPNTPIIQHVELIDGKKAQNIMIFLAKLKKYNLEELRDAILGADQTIITETVAKHMIEHLPTRDEIAVLKDYREEGRPLRQAEAFLKELLKIDRCEERLRALQFSGGFPERHATIEQDIAICSSALTALQSSEAWTGLLEFILTIGNYLNSGSFIGQVHGFRIGSLNKLVNTKATSKVSLLHFIAGTVDAKFPQFKSFINDLKDVYPAARVSFPTMQEDLEEMRRALGMVRTEVEFQKAQTRTSIAGRPVNPKDRFVNVMDSFLEDASSKFTHLDERHRKLLALFESTVILYGEETAKTSPEEFFSLFTTFLDSFAIALAESKKEREREELLEKRRKAQEEREAMRRKRHEIEPFKMPTLMLPTGDCGGGLAMDDLLESLKRGNIPGGGGRPKPRLPQTVALAERASSRQASTSSIGNKALELLVSLKGENQTIEG